MVTWQDQDLGAQSPKGIHVARGLEGGWRTDGQQSSQEELLATELSEGAGCLAAPLAATRQDGSRMAAEPRAGGQRSSLLRNPAPLRELTLGPAGRRPADSCLALIVVKSPRDGVLSSCLGAAHPAPLKLQADVGCEEGACEGSQATRSFPGLSAKEGWQDLG